VAANKNLALVKRFTDALDSGDMRVLDSLIADDVVWHTIGAKKPIRGKAALRAGMPGGPGADYTITGKLHDILVSDDHAIALVDATATRGGKKFKYRTAEIYHVRNGQVVERWAFSDDTAAITKFFG
jgi:ketosteroid isomerase-like protein